MKKIFLLSLLPLFFERTLAQSDLPPVYEIKNDPPLFHALDNSYYQLLEDSIGRLTIDDVMHQPVSGKFHFNNSSTNVFDFKIHAYWFRYVLKNNMDHDAEISFGDSNEESDFYFSGTGNAIIHKTLGRAIPLSKQKDVNVFKQALAFPVVLKPGEEVMVYNRAHNSHGYWFSARSFSIGFSNTRKLYEQNYTDSEASYSNGIHDSILFGELAFAALVSFFFFLIVRERVYLYFSLYMLDLGLGRMVDEFNFIFFKNLPVLSAYIFELIWVFSTFLMTLFIRSLLRTKIHVPRWNKFLTWLNYLYLLYGLSMLLLLSLLPGNPRALLLILGSINALVYLCDLLSFFLVLDKSKSRDRLLLIAVLPAFAIWAAGQSIVQFYNGSILFLPEAFTKWVDRSWYFIETFCVSWLAVFYSWVLLQRFSELRRQMVRQALEKEIERSQLIEQQKVELEKTVEERTAELKHSLHELKSTQAQLIQQEKMASLGELAAGIAHEIQNPLNFVNNFSEVNNELVEELKIKNEKLKIDDSEVGELLKDIRQNNDKISIHGKRADAIVKGMLQHSTVSTGQKELTGINALCDEYFRLAYHGMRAKDKGFNAEIKSEFDDTIGEINIVPQEIGRVILNLINNAFYAVSEKKKTAENGYEPIVTVSTKKINNKVEIKVIDNGNGIPQKILDKIFQPFFTTKPTGQGTGLGLSLAYDIVKAHGGEIKVETTESKGTEFIIVLNS